VVVVSLGLLGAVALQATALRNNQGSYERTQTAILTQGIFDAMRANMHGRRGLQHRRLICVAPAATDLASRDLARWITSLHSTDPPRRLRQPWPARPMCARCRCNGTTPAPRAAWPPRTSA
jgi:Tfp pilus assembly protein PilV